MDLSNRRYFHIGYCIFILLHKIDKHEHVSTKVCYNILTTKKTVLNKCYSFYFSKNPGNKYVSLFKIDNNMI